MNSTNVNKTKKFLSFNNTKIAIAEPFCYASKLRNRSNVTTLFVSATYCIWLGFYQPPCFVRCFFLTLPPDWNSALLVGSRYEKVPIHGAIVIPLYK